MLNEVQRWIDDSRFDNWEVYFLLVAIAISLCIHYEIRFVTSFLSSLDNAEVAYDYTVSEILISALQGIVMGMIGGRLYSQGDSYFAFITDSFDTKETTFMARVGVMTLIGILVGLVIPEIVTQNADYIAVQAGGAVVFVGYILIHSEISNWRLWNEAPVVTAGFLLAVVPLLG